MPYCETNKYQDYISDDDDGDVELIFHDDGGYLYIALANVEDLAHCDTEVYKTKLDGSAL